MDDFNEQFRQEAIAKTVEENRLNEDTTRIDDDGTVFEYDSVRRAWFPKIDEDFIARYQMAYGNYQATTSAPVTTTASSSVTNVFQEVQQHYHHIDQDFYDSVDPNADQAHLKSISTGASTSLSNKGKKGTKRGNDNQTGEQKKAPPPAWFEMDDSRNTNVYVSGLPTDITEDEYKELMNKVGLVAYDPVLKAPKLKLYKSPDGTLKGDGRCCYMKAESVELALSILDGSDFKGHKIFVEKATFQQKGQYDPSRKKRKLSKHEKKKFTEKQEKLLAWLPPKTTDSRPKFERTCVIKNVFLPKEFDEDPSFYNDIVSDMREECTKYGDIKKVVVYDRHEDGVVTVTFKTPEEADKCVEALHGRWFAKRQLTASNWDGRAKYVVAETEQEMEERLNKWHTYLETNTNEGK